MKPIISLSQPASSLEPPVKSLTEAQAKELMFILARSAPFGDFGEHTETRAALIRKDAVERGPDGRHGASLIGIASLANHLAWIVRLRVRAAERLARHDDAVDREPTTADQQGVLTPARAKLLTDMFCRAVRFEYYPGIDHLKDAVVQLRLVERGVDGKYGLAASAFAALGAYFTEEARKRDVATCVPNAERAAA